MCLSVAMVWIGISTLFIILTLSMLLNISRPRALIYQMEINSAFYTGHVIEVTG